jgi:hypothetical protein
MLVYLLIIGAFLFFLGLLMAEFAYPDGPSIYLDPAPFFTRIKDTFVFIVPIYAVIIVVALLSK